MNLSISEAEQKVVGPVRSQWNTLTAEAKAEITSLVKADLGFMAARPWTYTGICVGFGAVVTLVVRAIF